MHHWGLRSSVDTQFQRALEAIRPHDPAFAQRLEASLEQQYYALLVSKLQGASESGRAEMGGHIIFGTEITEAPGWTRVADRLTNAWKNAYVKFYKDYSAKGLISSHSVTIHYFFQALEASDPALARRFRNN